jgi:hypothetical protein
MNLLRSLRPLSTFFPWASLGVRKWGYRAGPWSCRGAVSLQHQSSEVGERQGLAQLPHIVNLSAARPRLNLIVILVVFAIGTLPPHIGKGLPAGLPNTGRPPSPRGSTRRTMSDKKLDFGRQRKSNNPKSDTNQERSRRLTPLCSSTGFWGCLRWHVGCKRGASGEHASDRVAHWVQSGCTPDAGRSIGCKQVANRVQSGRTGVVFGSGIPEMTEHSIGHFRGGRGKPRISRTF